LANHTKTVYLLSIILVLINTRISFAQPDMGGTPRSFRHKTQLTGRAIINLQSPDQDMLAREDLLDAGLEKPYRVGVTVPADLNPYNSGIWEYKPDGSRIWRLQVKCKGAVALGIDYEKFYLPAGSDLFIYNSDYSHISGAFTSMNNTGDNSFSTRPIRGDEIILEYYQPARCNEEPIIDINGLVYLYRGMGIGTYRSGRNFGGSGACEVNVNCPEGDAWKSQAQGVVRILARVKNQTFWCTGSLINNTSLDYAPLVLTANHCSENGGSISSTDDLKKWIFYFNYESATCADPASEPADHSMVGAVKLASSENLSDIGSDFYLVKITDTIPPAYNPYYNGWDRSDNPSASGVGIHHPEGDIKKVSTYSVQLTSGSWQSTPNTHWKVSWTSTGNGFGVTEPGSSGSPLFDSSGLLIGTLTGGESGCTNTSGIDYYGKVAFSWQSNGVADSLRLKPWLDPLNEGRVAMEGSFNDKMAVSDFEADTTTIPIGGKVGFLDRSLGNPTSWNWIFEGGEPSGSTEQNPEGIKYNSFGKYSVKLTVSNQYGADTLTKSHYIDVKALVYPNPTNGIVTIFTDSKSKDGGKIEIFNLEGGLVKVVEWDINSGTAIQFEMPGAGNFFFIRMSQGDNVQTEKIIVIR
jgi:PKD repeat protein